MRGKRDRYAYEYDEYDESTFADENCISCFYSDGKFCTLKCKCVSKTTPICWSYKNLFTMRASSDFQDDNEDFYDDDFFNK